VSERGAVPLPPEVRKEPWRPDRPLAIGMAVAGAIAVTFAVVLLVGSRAPSVDEPGPLEVCADATLDAVMPAVAIPFRSATGAGASVRYDASSRLADRYLQGLECDVFVSGDRSWVHALALADALDESHSVVVARTALVAAVRSGTPRPRGLPELASLEFPRIGIGAEATPLGEYARHALERSVETWNVLVPRFVRARNPRDLRDMLARGEVDVALTTRAEVNAVPGLEIAFTFPETLTGEVAYVAAPTGRSRRPRGAAEFVKALATPDARAAVARAGLDP